MQFVGWKGKKEQTRAKRVARLDVSCLLAFLQIESGSKPKSIDATVACLTSFSFLLQDEDQDEVSFFVSVCMRFSQAGLILTPRTLTGGRLKVPSPALALPPSLPPSSNLTTTMSHLSFPSAPHTNENNYHSLTASASLPFLYINLPVPTHFHPEYYKSSSSSLQDATEEEQKEGGGGQATFSSSPPSLSFLLLFLLHT